MRFPSLWPLRRGMISKIRRRGGDAETDEDDDHGSLERKLQKGVININVLISCVISTPYSVTETVASHSLRTAILLGRAV